MLPEIGKPIRGLPPNMRFVRDIEQFEGPILSEYRSEEGGGSYLQKWCTQTEDGAVHRFLLIRSDQRSVALYLAMRIPMRRLLEERGDGIGFLVDRSRADHGETVSRVAVVSLDELPPDYLPDADTNHDVSLQPR